MQDEDFKWFIENYSNLYGKYGTSYLVISNKKIIGSYQNPNDAISNTIKNIPYGQFIVQLCNGEESGYTNYVFFTHLQKI